MMTEVPLARCAFVVCRFRIRERTQMLLVNDARWGDFTFVGGHQEDADGEDPERTARRETIEELGSACQATEFRLIPLGKVVEFGPTWSKSARALKRYQFRFFGIEFDKQPNIKEGPNAAGFNIKLVNETELSRQPMLSNIVKLFLQNFGDKLDQIPLSWIYPAEYKTSIYEGFHEPPAAPRLLDSPRPAR